MKAEAVMSDANTGRMEGYIVLINRFYREGRKWVALCEELGTSTFGRTLTEADERLQEAILCHLDTLEDVGEQERFFKDHKIQFHRTRPTQEIQIRISADSGEFIRPRIQRIPTRFTC
ncbi:MAG: type II toxin-antitoxin system HicB family antitoxin [Chloroflexi bacterium]|nr:type II toxin-antitoxin system HicB family antitoxin [Chloroflexota bacterium]MBM3175176.1 type II toxin-antitoxin system HicB family antitoxin [Chloroflexota bacterium]